MCAQLLVWQNLFRTDCFIPRFDLGLVVQNHVQQGIMDFQFSVVFDEAQFAEFVHEKAHPRSGRADHLRQRFRLNFPTIGSGLPSLPKFASRRRSRARRFSLELNNWSTKSSSIRLLRVNRYDMNSSENSGSL